MRREFAISSTLTLAVIVLLMVAACGSTEANPRTGPDSASGAIVTPAASSTATPAISDARTTIIDWVPFIKFNDITYLRTTAMPIALGDKDLDYFTEVRFKVDGNVNDSSYRIKNGDAAFLEQGTIIYSLKGYPPDFRLIAKTGKEMQLYEADTNPHARKGSDLLPIGDKVEYIGINSPTDGKTELASIREKSKVALLVEMVLHAPVDQTLRPGGGSQLFLAFHLNDDTVVTRSFRPDSGELSRGIILSDEFTRMIKSVIP